MQTSSMEKAWLLSLSPFASGALEVRGPTEEQRRDWGRSLAPGT